MSEAARMENILVILKVLAIILFVIVGLTAINVSNYVPFIPEHKVTATGDFWMARHICWCFNDFLSVYWFRFYRSKLSRST